MEPLVLAALGVVATTALKKGTEKAIDAASAQGRRWLGRYYAEHSDDARARAMENAAIFLADLAVRVDRLERAGEALSDGLKDPDFAATLEVAFRAAARTPSAEKKRVLAGLIEERLLAAPESRVSVATNIAVAAMPNLTEGDLLQLACITSIHAIRPASALDPATYTAWWVKRLGPFQDTPIQSSQAALHLAGCQLLHFTRDFRRPLEATLQVHAPLGWGLDRMPSEWRSWLQERWSSSWENVYPTPAGLLVGAEVCERHGVSSEVGLPEY